MSKKDNPSNDAIEVAGDGPFVAAFIDTALRDPRLSWKAKGIAAYLLSKPNGWRIWTADLIKRSTDGRDAVLTGLAELQAAGYLERTRTNDPETGFLQWRKTIRATPKTMWSEPCPENPVMVAAPSTGFPYTDKPSTDKPSTVNPTHSSSQGSNSHRKSEEGAAGAEGDPPTASEKGTGNNAGAAGEDTMTIIERICQDCLISAAPAMLAAYGFEHVQAEAVRWWSETPAHKRKANAGLLVYRIRTRKFVPLSAAETIMCDRFSHWQPFTEPDPEVESAHDEQHARIADNARRLHDDGVDTLAKYDPGNPVTAWSVIMAELKNERGDGLMVNAEGARYWEWLRECMPTVDGDTLSLMPPNDRFTTWSNARLAARLNRKLAVITRRVEGAPTRVSFAA